MSDINFTSYNIIDTIFSNSYATILAIFGLVGAGILVIAGIIIIPPEVKTGPYQKRFFDYSNNQLVVEPEYIVDWKYSLYLKIFSKQFHISRKKEIVLTNFYADSHFKIFLKPLTSAKVRLIRDYYDESTEADTRLITVRLDERAIKRKFFLHKHDEDHYFIEIVTPQSNDELKQKVSFSRVVSKDGSMCHVIITNNSTEIVHNYRFEMNSDFVLSDLSTEYRYIDGVTRLSNGQQNYILKDIKQNVDTPICISFVKRQVIPS